MNKKDRIAIALSIIYTISVIGCLEVYYEISSNFSATWYKTLMIIFISFLPVYWGYRFIKGDISFLPIWFKK